MLCLFQLFPVVCKMRRHCVWKVAALSSILRDLRQKHHTTTEPNLISPVFRQNCFEPQTKKRKQDPQRRKEVFPMHHIINFIREEEE